MRTTAFTAIGAVLLGLLLLPVPTLGRDTAEPAAAAATSSDLGKEQRWRDQVVDSLMDGDAVDLSAGDTTFLGLYMEADGGGDRGAVIVHGIGVHPNWPQIVYPLRIGLPARGWNTLSIQMPVLPNEASDADYGPLMDEVAPRLDAAIAYLRAQGSARVVIVAHSLGSTMANDYLASHADGVDAFVAIGMSSGTAHAGRDNDALLAKIQIPVLDLYGENDLESVTSGAAGRAKASSSNGDYHQAQVPDANHFFAEQDEALVDVVGDWLDAAVPAQ